MRTTCEKGQFRWFTHAVKTSISTGCAHLVEVWVPKESKEWQTLWVFVQPINPTQPDATGWFFMGCWVGLGFKGFLLKLRLGLVRVCQVLNSSNLSQPSLLIV